MKCHYRLIAAVGILAFMSLSCSNQSVQHDALVDHIDGSIFPSEVRILSHKDHGDSRWALIKGHVVDRDSSSPISGVNVFLTKTTFGAQTDNNGDFRINRIPPGTYQITFISVGFKSAKLDSVIIRANDLVTIECQLAFAGGIY